MRASVTFGQVAALVPARRLRSCRRMQVREAPLRRTPVHFVLRRATGRRRPLGAEAGRSCCPPLGLAPQCILRVHDDKTVQFFAHVGRDQDETRVLTVSFLIRTRTCTLGHAHRGVTGFKRCEVKTSRGWPSRGLNGGCGRGMQACSRVEGHARGGYDVCEGAHMFLFTCRYRLGHPVFSTGLLRAYSRPLTA